MNKEINKYEEKYLKYTDTVIWVLVCLDCLIFVMTIFAELNN
jgi:hypothetical protein